MTRWIWIASFVLLLAACHRPAGDPATPSGPPVVAVPTDAPTVPPATGRTAPAHVVVTIEAKEVELPLAQGATYPFWTFGGKVPGKFIRVRQGDTVEFHLRNDPADRMPHNIDLHAVTGPGGGAVSTMTAPGHETQFTFRALEAGLFVYHCAMPPVGMHIANGMYGLILVEPPGGLPHADREYYVMQSEVYTHGDYLAQGPQTFDMQKAVDERPTYVVFNGADGALVGSGALQAKVGEKIRLFVGNGGPNLTSSFHVIGAVFDRVVTGASEQRDIQTTSIPPGGAAMVEFTTREPGIYPMVDHAIFRAFNKGAVAQIAVTGEGDPSVYSGPQGDREWKGEAAPGVLTRSAP